MTAQERQALWFLLVLTLLGAGARLVRGRDRLESPADSAALASQLVAVDSAIGGNRQRGGKSRKARTRPAHPLEPRDSDPLATISAEPREMSGPKDPRRLSASALPSRPVVDLDVATQAEIETLPWVGPALAERIVRNRERCGAFGSLEALTRVAGVGSGIAERLSERVTFSGSPRHPSTVPSECNPRR